MTTFPTSELWHSVVAALTAELSGRAVVTLPLQRWSIVDALLEVVAEDVAVREAAAREEGRAEVTADAVRKIRDRAHAERARRLHLAEAEVERLRAEVAAGQLRPGDSSRMQVPVDRTTGYV